MHHSVPGTNGAFLASIALMNLIQAINSLLWGAPALILLVGTGLFLTIMLRFVQIRKLGRAFKTLFGKYDNDEQPGEISRFKALVTGLSGTIGTGNIAGVATAITMGGPGAIFWMWLTAIVGMATKYVSCTLAVKFREKDRYGVIAGGPMYTLKNGLNMPKLGGAFALFTIVASFGIGNTVQANSIVDGLHYVLPAEHFSKIYIGIILAILVGVVILGGIKRIAKVAAAIVPIMAIIYCGTAITVLALHASQIPAAFAKIFNMALNPHAAGGGMLGAAIRYGVARGVFSNEAGLGSAPIAHAAAKTKDPKQQGLVAMLDPLIDTLIICTMTALVIIINGNHHPNLTGASLSAFAFQHGLNSLIGAWVVGFGLIFFAYSTMIAWCYYGDRCVVYLLGNRAVTIYRALFTLVIIPGAIAPLHLIWELADLANILMAAPNLLSLILLARPLRGSMQPVAGSNQ